MSWYFVDGAMNIFGRRLFKHKTIASFDMFGLCVKCEDGSKFIGTRIVSPHHEGVLPDNSALL